MKLSSRLAKAFTGAEVVRQARYAAANAASRNYLRKLTDKELAIIERVFDDNNVEYQAEVERLKKLEPQEMVQLYRELCQRKTVV